MNNPIFKFCKVCNELTKRRKNGRCSPCSLRHAATYRERHIEKTIQRTKEWRKANPDKVKKQAERWRAENADKVKAYSAMYYKMNTEAEKAKTSAYRLAHPEKVKEWRVANIEKCRARVQNRRAKKRTNGGELSPDIAVKLYALQRGKCACCGLPLGKDYHMDHIMPISRGGKNIDSNIQLLRWRCNNEKHAKHPIDYMQSKGFLL